MQLVIFEKHLDKEYPTEDKVDELAGNNDDGVVDELHVDDVEITPNGSCLWCPRPSCVCYVRGRVEPGWPGHSLGTSRQTWG